MTPNLALQLATYVHKGQVDKMENDYISHPSRVADSFTDPDLRMVAFLHDVIEDSLEEGSPITLEEARSVFPEDVADKVFANNGRISEHDLRSIFSEKVVSAVVALTKVKGMEYDTYLEQVKANPIALEVKLADLADNVSRLDQLTDLITKDRLTKKYQKAMRAFRVIKV